MTRFLLLSWLLALTCCQASPSSHAASRASIAQGAAPVIPPGISQPIIAPDGNVVPCTAYPGPGAAGACFQK